MTLLESITKAAAAADAGSLSPPNSNFPISLNPDEIFSNFPISLNPDEIFSNLKNPQSEPPIGSSLVKPASGWKISELDSDLTLLSTDFSNALNKKLRNPKSLSRGDFLSFLNSFFKKNSYKIRLPIVSDPNPLDPFDLNFTRAAIEKLGFLIGREASSLIAEGCVVFEIWEVLETLILQNLTGNLYSMNLIEKLVEKNQSELLCLCVKKISDLRSSELYSILKFFLSPSKDSYKSMIKIRKEWESQALLAIEKVSQKNIPKKASNLAKEASILLMMAHDGFLSSEICLHYVFGSENFDGLVLSSAISRLDGFEVLGLVRYFMKWLEKYERLPEAKPCPSAGAVLGLSACESVPSLESVVRGLGLVLDEHFSYLVLNSEFRDELRAVERVVGSLVSEADLCCPVNDTIEHLKSEVRQHGGV